MILVGVREEKGWLYSEWRMTYLSGWDRLLKAAVVMYEQIFEEAKITCGDKPVEINSADDILKLEESFCITVEGPAKNTKYPLKIELFNKTGFAYATVPMVTDDFKNSDYESFNKAMTQFMDSLEIAMYR